jgi:hypothetical protein
MSKLLALVVGIEEGQLHHLGLDDATLDADRNALPRRALVDAGIGQADDLAQACEYSQEVTLPLMSGPLSTRWPSSGCGCLGQREAHQFAFQWLGFEDVHRARRRRTACCG